MRYNLAPIHRAIKEKAVDQSWLAYRIKRSVATVSLTLAGLRANPKTIKAIADVLKVPMDELVVDEVENEEPVTARR